MRRAKKILFLIIIVALVGMASVIIHKRDSRLRKARKNAHRQGQIIRYYKTAKNRSDVFNFAKRLAENDSYSFEKIKSSWDKVGYMFSVPYLMFHYSHDIRA